MRYEGIPEELTEKMDRCVSKMVKDGKGQDVAVELCKTSILSQKETKKKKPLKVVAQKETETRLVYFSQTPVPKENKLDASKEGKMLRNVEIFKSGTYRGIQFKNSGLDKMVANFHYLKSLGIFTNVPVRADHPNFFGMGDVIDKIGGYVADLKRVGNKLVADVRITSEKMWSKIQEGTYISRSAEIGAYEDNDGTVYSPILYGFAWVDIPQVEGLSPKFNYSRDNKNFELINLNALMNMDPEDKFPPEEAPVEEAPKEETPKEETPVEAPTEELNKSNEQPMEFEKAFPQEAEELKKLKEEKLAFELEKRASFVEQLEKDGKITPAQKEAEVAFVKDLTEEQFAKYKEAKEIAPAIVKLDKEVVEVEEPKKEEEPVEKTAEEKADDFIKETA
jgi:hypothetical protein